VFETRHLSQSFVGAAKIAPQYLTV